MSVNTNAGILQTLDYKYHIRGGLKGINLDANNDLTNNLFSYKLTYEEDGTYYDGNIRNQYWKSNIDGIQRAYQYNYDGASRITAAAYGSTKAGENYALNDVTYDANGNIKTLSRNGWKSNNTFGLIDNLNYTYSTYSNKILKVDDISNETASFSDVSGNDYTYWQDGSLKSDNNKGITLIEYNYLKLPKKVVQNGVTTLYQYDATGRKLKETIGSDITDYSANKIYKNNILYQISHDEGRIVNGEYEYNIKDHLGNLRVAFKDSLGIAKITQANAYGVWGEDLPTLKYLNTPKINNFGYLNREFQSETGYTDLVNRQFDNIIGRFISQDPVIEGQEHLSLYQYGWNNPILRSDPDGKWPGEGLWNKAKETYNKASNFIRENVSIYRKQGYEITAGLRVTGEMGKTIGGDINAGSVRLIKGEESKDAISDKNVTKTKDWIGKKNEKSQPTATMSFGVEGAAEVSLGAKKEIQINHNLQQADNTNEIQFGIGLLPPFAFIIKYENSEVTGDQSLRIGLNASVKAGAGLVIDAGAEGGIKIKLPKIK